MEQSILSWILISLSIFSTFSCFPSNKWCCKEVADWSSVTGGISQMSGVWSHFAIHLSASGDHTSYPSNVPCVALDHRCLLLQIYQNMDSLQWWLKRKSIIFTHQRKTTFKCCPSFIWMPCSRHLFMHPPLPDETLVLKGWGWWRSWVSVSSWITAVTGDVS